MRSTQNLIMEMNPFCKECLENHPHWKLVKDKVFLLNEAGRPSIPICNLIKDMKLSDGMKAEFEEDDLNMLELLSSSTLWAEAEFDWKARWYQDTMLKCSAYRKVNRIGRRAGKCLHEDEMVTLSDGSRVRACEMTAPITTEQPQILSYDQDTSSFVNKNVRFHNNGTKEVFEIELDDGTILKRTGNHPLLTSEGWKDCSGVLGRKVAVPLRVDRFGKGNLDDDAIKILAYMIGDGNTTQRNCRFSSASDIILRDLNKSLESYGSRLKKYNSDREYDYHIVRREKSCKKYARDLLRDFDVMKKNSHNKRVPDQIMKSTKSCVALFLNRLFATDGWSTEKAIGYCSVNRDLIDDIFELLLRFGIRARRRTKDVRLGEKTFLASELNITDKDSIIKFADEINIFSKEEAIASTVSRFSKHGQSSKKFDHYGKEVWSHFTGKIRTVLRTRYGLRPEYGPNKHILNKALEDFNIDFNEFANEDIGWAKVKSIKSIGKHRTISISVENTSTFITDVIEHNTETLCVKMMHYAYTNEHTTSLVIAPYKNQVGLIFDRLEYFLSTSPGIKASIKRNTKNPYRVELHNGSKIMGFTSGTRTGAKSTGIRGQDAHAIFLDEADFLSSSDFEVILAILASRPDCYLWASSTPIGKREMYWRWCTDKSLGFKEFHYPSSVSPAWTKETEILERSMYSEQGYNHEFEANFGEEAEGVFLNNHIDDSLSKFNLGKIRRNDKSLYTIGVDWNTSEKGTHVIVTEWNQNLKNGSGAFRPVEKVIIGQTEFTQTKACEEIIKLNEKWNPGAIYVDQGFGYAQIELLHKYGLKNLNSGLVHKVKGINFGDKIEIRDPATRQKVKKHIKPFIVNLCVKRLEDGYIMLPEEEDVKHGLVGQMRDFTVVRRSAAGQPIYSDDDDHSLVAFMLTIHAATMENSDMVRLNTVPHIALGGTFGEHKDKNLVVNKKRADEKQKEAVSIVPRWSESKYMFNDTSLHKTLELQQKKSRFGNKRAKTLKELKRFRQGLGTHSRAKI